jgi:hypothetical protein
VCPYYTSIFLNRNIINAKTKSTKQKINKERTCINSKGAARKAVFWKRGITCAKGNALAIIPKAAGISEIGMNAPLNSAKKMKIPMKN